MRLLLRSCFFSALVLSVVLTARISYAAAPQYMMFTVGDSISAAFLAKSHAVLPTEAIPRGLGTHMEYPDALSWSSGNKIQSHFERLQEYLAQAQPDSKLIIHNVAKSGATSSDLSKQADLIIQKLDHGYYRAKYITFLMGSNDACSDFPGGTPPDEFERNLRVFFAKIASIRQDEKLKIFVSSIPRIPDLAKPQIFDHSLNKIVSCRTMHLKVHKFCTGLVDWRSPAEYENRIAIVERINAILKRVAEESAIRYPQLQIVYSDQLYNTPITLDHLAWDCFHPNVSGQAAIAEATWSDVPWFRDPLHDDSREPSNHVQHNRMEGVDEGIVSF